MRTTWYFIHIVGYTLWIGGALAAMVLAIAAKREPAASQGTATRLQTRLYPTLIGPGAAMAVVSGLILTLEMYNQVTAVGLSHWLMAMQGLGLIAGILVIVAALPTAAKLSRVDPIADPGVHAGLRKRLTTISMGANSLAMIALVTGALYRYGV